MLGRAGLVGADLRRELADAYDRWLAQRVGERDDVALVAVGGLGRREPAPHSDLDLVLLHDGGVADLAALADSIWYPIWDARVGLDHAVRTPAEAAAVARSDLKALLGLLYVRHVGGNPALTARVRSGILDVWRASADKRLPELQELARARWAVAGDAAFLLEPNLKESRGALRDAHALQALAAAQLVDYPVRVRAAYEALLDVRGELHRRAGGNEDVLRRQEQDGVAEAFDTEPDVLLRRVNEAARAIAHGLDLAWRRVDRQRSRPARRRLFGASQPSPDRVGLAPDVVAQDGEVVLARDADPGRDPVLVLRVARAAAEHDLPIAPFALERLGGESVPLPAPWPPAARHDFVALLGAGPPGIPVLEALDQAGLLVRLIPEWDALRCRAQHNPVHRFTVDRHLLETAAAAAERDGGVDRRDLLLLGALLHDIGKGFPAENTPGSQAPLVDHSVTGAERAATIAARMGLTGEDLDTVVALVRHHLLLPNTATRRDLDDPRTIAIVRQAIGDSAELLDLLHALAIADAAATGPAAWSDWKAGLVADLVARVRAAVGGTPLPAVAPLDDDRRALAERGEVAVLVRPHEVVIAAPDVAGTLYRSVGVLALHALDVRVASIHTHAGTAVNRFAVEPRFGRMPDAALVRGDLVRALRGELGLAAKLADKERTYARRPPGAAHPRPAVLWFDDATDATVIEFRGEDGIGLLCRITAALERAGLDVRSARVSSAAGAVVDAFYVTDRDGRPVDPAARSAVEAELRAAAWPTR